MSDATSGKKPGIFDRFGTKISNVAASVYDSGKTKLDERKFNLEKEAYEKCRKTICEFEKNNKVGSPLCPKAYGGKPKRSKKGSKKKKSKKKSSKKKGGKR